MTTTLRQPPGTAVQAMTPPKKRSFLDFRTDAKVAEDDAEEAVKAGAATPEQAKIDEDRKAILNSPAGNSPFDTPIAIPAIGLRAATGVAGAAVDAAPGLLTRSKDLLTNSASSTFNGLRSAFGSKVPQPVAAGATNAATRPAATEAAETILAQPVLSREAQEYLTQKAATSVATKAASQSAPAATSTVAQVGLRPAVNDVLTQTGSSTIAGLAPTSSLPSFSAPSVSNSNADLRVVESPSARAPVETNAVSLRGGLDMGSPDANLRQSISGMAEGQKINVGPGISASQTGGKLTLSNAGPSAGSNYESTAQYRDGVVRAAKDKAALAEIESGKKEAELRDGLRTASIGDRAGARAALKNFHAEKLQTQKETSAAGLKMAELSAATAKANREQANSDRDFSLRSQESVLKQREGREASLVKKLEGRNTMMVDGKPVVNADAVREQRMGLERAAARMGTSVDKLDAVDEERLVAASRLLSKVQTEATNWPIPWKPDYLKTIDPLDLVGLKRNKSGDAVTRDGQVIPARFIEKMQSEHILPGSPTNEFDILFTKG